MPSQGIGSRVSERELIVNWRQTVLDAQQGNRDALAELYRDFSPLVRALCFDQTGDYHAAWDIFQDVFLVMVSELPRLRNAERFPMWLVGIARRKAAEYVRRLLLQRQRMKELNEESTTRDESPAKREVLGRLHLAVKGLSERERLAIQLFYIEEYPVSQILAVLGLSRSTAYQVLAQARTRLRRQ